MSTTTADNPIRLPEDDVLGRARAADSFADQILSLDISEGVVVGVLGPWGSGKTSFVNLARPKLESSGAAVLDFNPWMFSGAEQLVASFFIELSAQLRLRPELAGIGKDVEEYGELFSGLGWLPLVGPWIERGRAATQILAKLLQRRKEGAGARRSKVGKALGELEKPLVVVLDDIDRLTTTEIQDVFKLVRLTANFPNVIYVVAFDRARVEQALSEKGLPGRAYLEKIIQVGVDLPFIPNEVLVEQITKEIDKALSGVENPGPFYEDKWPDIFMEVIRPLVKNMRDVRRYAIAVRGTVKSLDGQVSLTDVLALEAVRVFMPDVFYQLQYSVDGLTTTHDIGSSSGLREPPHLKEQVERLLALGKEHTEVIRAMILRLFPAGERHAGSSYHYGSESKSGWLRKRRVAHEDNIRLYLEGVVGEGLKAFNNAEQAWSLMSDQAALDSFFRSLPVDGLERAISSLETYQDQFTSDHVVPGSIVLLNLYPLLPERPRGMFDFGPRIVVSRVVLRLLRTLKDHTPTMSAVQQILPQVNSLSAKLELVTDVGYRDDAGHKLVAESDAKALEKHWRDEVRAVSSDALVAEKDLIRILLLTKREADPSEPPLAIADSPNITLELLRSSRSESQRRELTSRAVRRSPRLAWDALVELFDGEDPLRERITKLEATRPENEDELLQLAKKYLSGWRPGDED